MEKKAELYRGKAKSVYSTDDPSRLVLLFRNDTSAFDGQKVEQLDRKGMVNNKFNHFIMTKLEEAGIPTQMDRLLSDNEALVKKLQMVPVECVVRNVARRFNLSSPRGARRSGSESANFRILLEK